MATHTGAGPLANLRKRLSVVPHILWFFVCVVALGFPAKYRERLRLFEDLVDLSGDRWSTPPKYSDKGHSDSNEKTMRQKQQEEWDRLNIAVSVITATSAAALAIQATSSTAQIHWLVTTFYSIAFGLSLQGLILITYMTISAGGASDEAICRIARGELFASSSLSAVKPVAFTMALPAILATYSSIYLLAGLVVMVIVSPGTSEGVQTRRADYITTTMIPVGTGFLCLCLAILLCEIGSWIELHGRRSYKRRTQNISN